MAQTKSPGSYRLIIILSVFFMLLLQTFLSAQCYELVWSEEFDYTGLPDPEIWTQEVGGHGWGNNELQYYTRKDSDNVWVEDGTLIITALKENYSSNNYTSSRLITRGKKEFKYGKIEARLKLPYGQGIWPAFWMLGTNVSEVSWPACGEIDIMEFVGGGTGDKTTYGTIHWEQNGHASYGGSKTLSSGRFADDFHLFSVVWDAKKITWYLDDIQFFTADIRPSGLSEFHQDFFIILNLAVGGDWPGSPDGTTVFPQQFEVDYVRVYESTESIKISGDQEAATKEKNLTFFLPDTEGRTFDWSVPEGATITSGQGTNEIMVDWGCEPGFVTCDLATSCDTLPIDFSVALDTNIIGDLFVEENQTGYLLYAGDMDSTTYQWSVPPDAVIVEGQGTDSIFVDWGVTPGYVTLTLENECGTTSLEKFQRLQGQYPYPNMDVPNQIPGTIIPTHYDYGGEGVAYHDVNSGNLGPGPRQDEGVDTEYNDGSESVGWIETGEWIEYSIEVEEPGIYDVKTRVATIHTSGGSFNLLFNGEDRLGTADFPGTGDWTDFITFRPGRVYLTTQDTMMRIVAASREFNLGKITFTFISTGTEENFSPHLLNLYPNPANEYLQVNHAMEIKELIISDLSGRILFHNTGEMDSSYILDTSQLLPGTYIISIRNINNDILKSRFIRMR